MIDAIALILRRDNPRLSLPNSIMDRAHQWLRRTDAVWNAQAKTYRFPSGAVLQFGFIDNPDDRYRYASSEYQFIGWDELTEFRLATGEANPYEFMFSRLRKTHDIAAPLRMRSASNPGNLGHHYVKQRFITDEALNALRDDRPQVFYADSENKDRAFVPALLVDNPFIDQEQYVANLLHLPAVTRARLLQGDWSVQENAVIQVEWIRRYDTRGEILIALSEHLDPIDHVDRRKCQCFATIDTAGTSKEKAADAKGKPPSWSVCAVWDFDPRSKFLFLRDLWRDRVGWDGLKAGTRAILARNACPLAVIENAHHGRPLADELRTVCQTQLIGPKLRGMNNTSADGAKLERAVASGMLTKLEAGQLFLPRFNNAWAPRYESELLSWTGLPEETADQIDATSYAV